MDAPPVQYVTTSDGYNIAYCVIGQGRPLVLLPNVWSHIQLFWHTPWRRSLFDALASRFRLIQFDGRGQGLSTRGLAEAHTGDDYLLDIDAVVDRLGLDRFALLARNPFCQVAMSYAVKNPERLEALILGNPASDLYRGFDDLMGGRWEVYTEAIARLTNLPSDAKEMAADFRRAVDQADHIKLVRAFRTMDVEHEASRITTPTLVIISSTSPLASREMGIRVASEVPGAQIISLDDPAGSSGFFSTGTDLPPAVFAIEQFLAGTAEQPREPALLPDRLSAREADVLRLVAEGKSNAQIAEDLVISQNTVIRHVSNIFAKTGVANRAEAASYAHRHGVV